MTQTQLSPPQASKQQLPGCEARVVQPSRLQKLQQALKNHGWFIVIMLCAIATAVSYHFVGHPRTILIYDARSYLWTSAHLAKFFIQLSHLHWSPELLLDPKFREHIVSDGPLFPAFIGGVFALFQHVPRERDWFNIEIVQSIVHGLTAGLVYLITLRLFDANPVDSQSSGVRPTVVADTIYGAGASDESVASSTSNVGLPVETGVGEFSGLRAAEVGVGRDGELRTARTDDSAGLQTGDTRSQTGNLGAGLQTDDTRSQTGNLGAGLQTGDTRSQTGNLGAGLQTGDTRSQTGNLGTGLQTGDSRSQAGNFGAGHTLPGARLGAIVAGLLWAFYPAANIGTGIMYTETFVMFTVALFTWSAITSSASRARDFLCGVCAAVVFLLKPALLPAVGLSCAARFFFSEKKVATGVTMAAALVLTLAPWALYTHFVCGKMQLTTNRFAAYNIAMGSDTEVEGRLVLPITPLTNFASANEKDALNFVASQWKYNTAECIQMTVRKLPRLLGYPWNDFRHKFFGLDAAQQRGFHLILLFLGLTGFSLAAFSRKVDRSAMPILVVMAFMWTPLTYLLFEANPRYGFSVMPFYAAFSGFLIAYLSVPAWRKRWKPLALSVVSGAALTTIILQCANWAADPSKETTIELKPQQTLVSQIDLKNVKPPQMDYESLILLDGERSIENAHLKFNGHDLRGHLEHLRYLDSRLYDGFYVTKEVAHFMDADPEVFRQWRAVRVPKEWINWSGDNEIRVTVGPEGGTVYGDTDPLPERLPSFRHNCPNRIVNTDTGFENRVPLLRPSRSVGLTSHVEGDNAAPIVGSARVRIAVVTDSMKDRKKLDPISGFAGFSDAAPEETLLFSESIAPERFPTVMRSATGDGTIQTNRFVMNLVTPCAEIKLPPPTLNDNIYKFRLTGSVRANKPGRVSALLCNGRFAVLSKVPPSIDCGPEWKTFELEDRMPVQLLRSTPSAQAMVALALYPGQWLDESGYGPSKASSDARFRDLKLSVWSSKQLNLAQKQVFVY